MCVLAKLSNLRWEKLGGVNDSGNEAQKKLRIKEKIKFTSLKYIYSAVFLVENMSTCLFADVLQGWTGSPNHPG